MARNLEALTQPLPVVAEPGLDALDPRFTAITSLASRGQYTASSVKDEPPAAAQESGAAEPSSPEAAAPDLAVMESGDALQRRVTLAVSFRFLELVSKLRAFDALIQRRQFRKAAVVADDLQHLIESFDPRSYFPEIFAGFSAQLAENVGMLSEHWDDRETIAWKALGQFYQTDLDRFVKG